MKSTGAGDWLSLDRIRRAAIDLLSDSESLNNESFGIYAAGVVDLVKALEETAEKIALDKSGGDGE